MGFYVSGLGPESHLILQKEWGFNKNLGGWGCTPPNFFAGSHLKTLAEVDEVVPKERLLVEGFNLWDIVLDILLHLAPASLITDQTLQHRSHLINSASMLSLWSVGLSTKIKFFNIVLTMYSWVLLGLAFLLGTCSDKNKLIDKIQDNMTIFYTIQVFKF